MCIQDHRDGLYKPEKIHNLELSQTGAVMKRGLRVEEMLRHKCIGHSVMKQCSPAERSYLLTTTEYKPLLALFLF